MDETPPQDAIISLCPGSRKLIGSVTIFQVMPTYNKSSLNKTDRLLAHATIVPGKILLIPAAAVAKETKHPKEKMPCGW